MNIEATSVDEGIQKVVELLALEIQSESKLNLVESKSVDEGNLLQSSDGTLKSIPGEVRFTFTAPYADSVEYGREAGVRPPFDPIRAWAKRKLGVDEKNADRVAWAICSKIEKSGVEPNPFVRNAISKVISKYS